MHIERLTRSSEGVLREMNRLLVQLTASARTLTMEHLDRLVAAPHTYLFVARINGVVVFMLTLVLAPIPTGFHGYIEDVVVDQAFRGRGVAQKLIRKGLDTARAVGATKVDLTSNPSRQAANHLYVSLGFERRQTNVYRYRLE